MESPTFNPPTCLGSPVSLHYHLVLGPLVTSVSTLIVNRSKPFPKHSRHLSHHMSILMAEDRRIAHITSANVTATPKLKNTIIPHSIHLMLPPNDHSSVGTSQEFWEDLGSIWDHLVFICMFSVLFWVRLAHCPFHILPLRSSFHLWHLPRWYSPLLHSRLMLCTLQPSVKFLYFRHCCHFPTMPSCLSLAGFSFIHARFPLLPSTL